MQTHRKLALVQGPQQQARLLRLARDDARTAIDAPAADALAQALRKAVRGEVRFGSADRALYATDASNYRQAPIGVVVPRDAADVESTFAIARSHEVPVLARGGGTSLAGQCCNVAVVLDFSKYMRNVLAIDGRARLATVEPGCVLDHLREQARQQAGLTFGPDPATHTHCTLGGMLGNNSCGSHSLMSKNAGLGLRTSDNTFELEVLTYRGERFRVGRSSEQERARIITRGGAQAEIYRRLQLLVDRYGKAIRESYPQLERRVSGYNLPDLLPENGFDVARALVGSESTCVTILQARLHLVPEPAARSLVVLGYPDIYAAADHLDVVLEEQPSACEAIDQLLLDYVKKKGDQAANLAILPRGQGFLIVEFAGASKQDSDAQAQRLLDKLRRRFGQSAPTMQLYDDPLYEHMIWQVREGGLGSTAWVPGMPDAWPGWEDSAVPVAKVATYLRQLHALFDRYDYHPSIYGHLGQGCVHCRVPFDLYTQDGIRKWRAFMEDATDLVSSLGGSYSGEHGDGQARGELLPKLFGPELMSAMREFKRIWDPDNRMNPGKLVDPAGAPYGMTDNLRLGPDYAPPKLPTHFSFADDQGSFARAALRCVGVGECRRDGGGTMCPSYMATHEEQHSTRGRARMLFEMLDGELIRDGWRSHEVKDALDLCLSCKGCKGDCPVNVDMATYKSEFLSHYYEYERRPRQAYAFGLIHDWARLASPLARVLNFLTHTAGSSRLAKWVAGIDRSREIPRLAPQSFRAWFRRHTPKHPDGPRVVLFPDTFNNYFHATTARAAVEVLEHAGFHVECPEGDVCCGRPLYDYGFLERARERLVQLTQRLGKYIDAGSPIVVLEPSCWAVFKDELTQLLPDDPRAKRLSQLVYTLGSFLAMRPRSAALPQLARRALLHGHCHQKSLEHRDDKAYGVLHGERALLGAMGLQLEVPDDGCCGMAGAFGFEAGEHCQVSRAVGGRALLPRVQAAADDTLLIADGFSCREQIHQETQRRALHLAEVLQLALRYGPQGPSGLPELALDHELALEQRGGPVRASALALASLAITALRGLVRWMRGLAASISSRLRRA